MSGTVILVTLTAICLLLTFHPFTTFPLSLWLVRACFGKQKLNPQSADRPQTFSILFCAYNEESVLDEKLKNLAQVQAANPDKSIEILAYNDCSADKTLDILNKHAEKITVINGEQRAGKSVGMNRLVAASAGEIIIFTDANVLLDNGVVNAFADVFSDPQVGVGCGHLIYTNRNTATADVGTSYWKFEECVKELETHTGSSMGADGSLFAIRRELFREVPSDIIDDFYTSLGILCRGHRSILVPDAIAYERSVDDSRQEYRRKVRIACRAFNCHRLLWPQIRKMSLWNQYKYISHRLIRWFVAIWLILAVIFALATVYTLTDTLTATILGGVVLIGFAFAYLLRFVQVPILSRLAEVWAAFCATSHGVICSLRGQRFQTWVPAASVRRNTEEVVAK